MTGHLCVTAYILLLQTEHLPVTSSRVTNMAGKYHCRKRPNGDQMAAAVEHTHLVAHTYHMDIKPGNFLLDEDSNLVLIDWEQSRAHV